MTTPAAPALLFISASALCSPGVDFSILEEIGDAIKWARERFDLWQYTLKVEGESDAFKRADAALAGAHLNVASQLPTRQLRRVLQEVSTRARVGEHPSAVWLLSDTLGSKPRRRPEIELFDDIQARLRDGATFRVLGARLGYPVRGDDLMEVFANHDRERAKAAWDEPEF